MFNNAATSSHFTVGWKERLGRVREWKAMGWDKTSLIGKANQGIHSSFPMGRKVSSHSQESRVPSSHMGDKLHHSKYPLLFLLGLYAMNITIQPEISMGQPGLTVPAVSSPSSLCIPSLLAAEVVQDTEKALMLWQHCSAITKISLCYQPCVFITNQKHSPTVATVKKAKLVIAKKSMLINTSKFQLLFFLIIVCLCLKKGKPLCTKADEWSTCEAISRHKRSGWSIVHR